MTKKNQILKKQSDLFEEQIQELKKKKLESIQKEKLEEMQSILVALFGRDWRTRWYKILKDHTLADIKIHICDKQIFEYFAESEAADSTPIEEQ